MQKSPLSQLFQEMLADKISNSDYEEIKVDLSPSDQKAIFSDFLSTIPSDFKVGDYVVLNDFGLDEYTIPRDGRVACIVDVFAVPLVGKSGNIYNGQIATVFRHKHDGKPEHNHFHLYPVDLRYFKKVEA